MKIKNKHKQIYNSDKIKNANDQSTITAIFMYNDIFITHHKVK